MRLDSEHVKLYGKCSKINRKRNTMANINKRIDKPKGGKR